MPVSQTSQVFKRLLAMPVVSASFVCMLLLAMPVAAFSAAEPAELLQPLVDAAEPGAVILLKPGTYAGPVMIDKPLTLRGAGDAGGTIVLNTGLKPAVTIAEGAEGTVLEGMSIVDETVKEEPSLLVAASRTVLDELHISTGANGINVRNADDGTVTRSTIQWAADGIRMAEKGNGIDLYNAHRWSMTDNVIADVHDGIYMENSDAALVADNVWLRSRYGVHCMYTKNTVIRDNEGHMNITGAMVMAAKQVTVADNTFTKQNENVNSQGILLFDAHETEITGNVVDGNRVGLYVELSSSNVIKDNVIRYNFIGIQLLEASENAIRGNMLLGNVSDAQARGSEANVIAENYWDSFQGIDADGDGKSDVSYAVNPFFQGLTQKRPPFQLFFQSPGMVFLESLYQSDRSRWAVDSAPLMAPPTGMMTGGEQSDTGAFTGIFGLGLIGCTVLLFWRMRRRS